MILKQDEPWFLGCKYKCQLCYEESYNSSLSLILHISESHNVNLDMYAGLVKSKTFETDLEHFTCELCEDENIKKSYEDIYGHLLYKHGLSICDYDKLRS